MMHFPAQLGCASGLLLARSGSIADRRSFEYSRIPGRAGGIFCPTGTDGGKSGAGGTQVACNGGTVYSLGPGTNVTSRAQFAAGMGPANVATPGSVGARLGRTSTKPRLR